MSDSAPFFEHKTLHTLKRCIKDTRKLPQRFVNKCRRSPFNFHFSNISWTIFKHRSRIRSPTFTISPDFDKPVGHARRSAASELRAKGFVPHSLTFLPRQNPASLLQWLIMAHPLIGVENAALGHDGLVASARTRIKLIVKHKVLHKIGARLTK